jgi:hypothetical protein
MFRSTFVKIVVASLVAGILTAGPAFAQKPDAKPDAKKPEADKKPDVKKPADGANPNAGAGLPATIKSVDAAKNTITVMVSDKGQKGAGMEQTYSVAANVQITAIGPAAGGKQPGGAAAMTLKLGDLAEGTQAQLTVADKTVTAIGVPQQSITGRLKSVDMEKKTLTLFVNRNKGEIDEKTFALATNVAVGATKGQGGDPALLKGWADKNETVALRLTPDRKTVLAVSLQGAGGGGVKKAAADKDGNNNPPKNADAKPANPAEKGNK